MKLKHLLLLSAALWFVGAEYNLPAAAAAHPAPIRIILWFDTEDYLLPASDDACKRVATVLTDRGIRATFKIVGEKARVLESRGRQDVIFALKQHDIAYHTDLHSVHPTPTEYLADCGLVDGVEEFIRREGSGAADVRRIFSVATLGCYGQPGSSWAPQAIAALKRIGVAPHEVPCYVDEGDHVGLNEKPFWYMGALNVYRLGENCTRMDLHDPQAVLPAKEKVTRIADRLRREGGGLISIYYHPCEWVHREFWDGVNFRRGANPPREQWKAPPQRPPEETAGALARFGEYVDHIRALPDVRFVTASDLPLLYPDTVRRTGATKEELTELARRITSGKLDFHVVGNRSYSVADQFELLTTAVSTLLAGKELAFPLQTKGLLGPDAPPQPRRLNQAEWTAFRDSTLDVLSFIETNRRIPARVFLGAEAIPPGDFLVALAQVWGQCGQSGQLPMSEMVKFEGAAELLPVRQVAEDRPGLFGGWVIHKEDFRAPKLIELARLQAWTLKPALPRE